MFLLNFNPARLAILALTASLLLTLPALAQPSASDPITIEPTEAQVEMNQRGVEAIVAGDFDKAARLFQASIDLGELNITYLNLGRALQKGARCREAKQAYLNVRKASTPKVTNPPSFEVISRAEQYLSELERTCPGEVAITCEPDSLADDVELYINTRGPERCADSPFEVAPGEVVVKGVLDDQVIERVTPVEPVGLAEISLRFEPHPEPSPTSSDATQPLVSKGVDEPQNTTTQPPNTPAAAPEQSPTNASASAKPTPTTPEGAQPPPPTRVEVSLEQPSSPRPEVHEKSGGAWWLAAGIGAIGGGVYLDALHPNASNGSFDATDYVPPGAYLLGGIALIYGLTNL